MLSHKQRVIQAIQGGELDRLPTQISFTPEMSRKVARHLGVPEEKLFQKLNNHIIMVSPDDTRKIDKNKGIRYDNWGIGWDMGKLTEGFLIRERPLEKLTTLEGYHPPDPNDEKLFNSAKKVIKKYGKEYFILSDQGWCMFEKAHCLQGFEKTLIDLTLNRKFIESLLDMIVEYQIAIAKKFIELGVDGSYTGDDFGAQKSLLFSPEIWRQVFKPRYEKLWGVFKQAGLPVFHHSCGDIREILPDMIEIGLDVLNPVQPQAMPIQELADKYGKNLTFWGGISVQKTLPFGTREEVEKEVHNSIQILGRYNKYIIGPSHDMTSDIPMENFDAMINSINIINVNEVKDAKS